MWAKHFVSQYLYKKNYPNGNNYIKMYMKKAFYVIIDQELNWPKRICFKKQFHKDNLQY